jgi:hypothetical protein
MKLNTIFKGLTLIAVTLFTVDSFAYNDDKEKERCRNPKIQEFTLPEYKEPDKKEVAPEAEFSFVVSGWADPKKIKLSAKNMDIPFTVQSTDTYHKVKAKLPAALTGQAVRINARIPAVLGCYSTIGWLIEVSAKAEKVETPKTGDTAAPSGSNDVTPEAPIQNEAAPSTSDSTPKNAEVPATPAVPSK